MASTGTSEFSKVAGPFKTTMAVAAKCTDSAWGCLVNWFSVEIEDLEDFNHDLVFRGFHSHGGTPIAGLLGKHRENPLQKRMITRGTPETSS